MNSMIPHTDRYLVMVTMNNNNKWYSMHDNSDGTFTAGWGRVGQNGARCTYPVSQWDAKYSEKIHKGYTDQSDTVLGNEDEGKDLSDERPEEKTPSAKSIARTEANSLISRLASFAKGFIRRHYITRSSSIKVNSRMINKVDELLKQMDASVQAGVPVSNFNTLLSEVFMAIPRVMDDTRHFYASTPADYGRILKREAEYIDSLRAMARTNDSQNSGIISTSDDNALADAEATIGKFGLKISPVTASQEADIRRHMGQNAPRYIRAWRIENKTTKKAFDAYRKKLGGNANVKQLWHGSKNENFHSILCSGLLLNPNASITGKMFGYGIYFAPSFAKSMGYTSIEGSYWAGGHSDTAYMAVFDVALGKSLDVYSYAGGYGSWKEKDIRKAGCDSLFAHKGQMLRNDEIIVYNEAAMTIRYLVEIK